MRSRWLARAYEAWWRPLTFALTTGFRAPSAEREAALVLGKLEGAPGPWLDLSCGPGTLTRHLSAAAGGRTVVAVDLSRAMLERAAVQAPRAARVRADASVLPFADGTFGAVVNLAALDLYPDAGRVIAETARVLAPGGRWICSTFVSRRKRPTPWARAAGLHTPSEGELASHAARAGFVVQGSMRFGSYVLLWADKP